jgi:hypothetical protein
MFLLLLMVVVRFDAELVRRRKTAYAVRRLPSERLPVTGDDGDERGDG